MTRRDRWAALLAGMGMALVVATTVVGYAGEVAGAVTVSPPSGTLKCNVPLTVTATVVDAASKVIEGQPVDWSFTSAPVSGDSISPTSSVTDASGVATTTVTLACVAGDRTISAVADSITASAVLGLTAAGLPRTSTVAPGLPFGDLPMGTILALLAVLVGGGLVLRRLAFSPR